ncbi:MAG: NAD kinase [Geodermatophilaceae bacterium]
MSADRVALFVTHTGRADIVALARDVAGQLARAGVSVRVLDGEAADLDVPGAHVVPNDGCAGDGAEIVLVLGGDGTFLRAAEIARACGAALVGVNLGRVGFLAETEPEALAETVRHIVDRDYVVEERLTLDVSIEVDGTVTATAWALNEASVEKTSRERMLEVVIEVDGRPLTSFGCDGVLCSTPTGSTAYAFSAGGPVVWPDVEALLLVPNSAHALFSRPLVTSPESVLGVCIAPDGHDAVLCCDGRRTVAVPPGARVAVRRSTQPVRVVRVHPTTFGDRLVAKFHLPVQGFREWRR